jgi:hypothetical protein
VLHWQVKSLFLLFHWLETNLACWLVDAGNIGVLDPIYCAVHRASSPGGCIMPGGRLGLRLILLGDYWSFVSGCIGGDRSLSM